MELPPEMRAQMEEAEAHRRMHMRDNTHALRDLLAALDKDQLTTLHMLVHACDNEQTSAYWRGQIAMMLDLKHEVCPCGTDHDQELGDLMGHTHAPDMPEQKGGRPIEDVQLPEEPVSHAQTEPPFEPVNQAEHDETLELYNIELNPDYPEKASEGAAEYRCKGCGVAVVSVEDRMLRKPGVDGCSGCQQKSAWG